MANAIFWVRYTDALLPSHGERIISLCSPDLVDTKKAYRRAMKTAKARLIKKGIKPINASIECVG